MALPAKAVIDTNLVVRAYIQYPIHREHGSMPETYQLVEAFQQGYFTWLWNEDILSEYRETLTDEELLQRLRRWQAGVAFGRYEQDEQLIRFTGEHVGLSVEAMAEARRLIASPGRQPARLQDLDDAVFLATADDGRADYIVSLDRAITTMGRQYAQAFIVPWKGFLQRLGYPLGVRSTTRGPSGT